MPPPRKPRPRPAAEQHIGAASLSRPTKRSADEAAAEAPLTERPATKRSLLGGHATRDAAKRALVLHPYAKRVTEERRRGPQARLAEAVGLAEAIGLVVAHAETVPLDRPRHRLGVRHDEAD